jgi:hypothetical protein
MQIELRNPSTEVQISVAMAYLTMGAAPDRTALTALAFCLCWPTPPWEADAHLEVERASQEEKEARQYLSVARPEERSGARQGLFEARAALQSAQNRLDALKPALRDLAADGRAVIAHLEAAGIGAATWYPLGDQILGAWIKAIMPAPEKEQVSALTFTLPRSAPTPSGGSVSPTDTQATL